MIWSWASFLSSLTDFLTFLPFFGDVPYFPSSAFCALLPNSESLVLFLGLWGLCSSLSPDVLGVFFPNLIVATEVLLSRSDLQFPLRRGLILGRVRI